MDLVVFDVDGTLIQSYAVDSVCFQTAVEDVLDLRIDTDWQHYQHVTDSGIVRQLIDELKLGREQQALEASIRRRFTECLSRALAQHPVRPMPGAQAFLGRLMARDDVAVALATGGWLDSALLKLGSAGIGVDSIPMATADDHFRRTDIILLAEHRAAGQEYRSRTYFGDGPWDQAAAQALGYRFVLVGDRVDHRPSIPDFSSVEQAWPPENR